VADIRHLLTSSNGSMGETGSVAWQFNRAAYFGFPPNGLSPEKVFELAVEAGADDVTLEDYIEIIGPVDAFKEISDRLKGAGIKPEEAELIWLPNTPMTLSGEETVQVARLIERLEELDDVRAVYSNLDLDEEAVELLETA
jgi:transcriptional/translational regulatory protein YebC/TACO1